MSSEAAPAQPIEGIFYEDGSINEAFLAENYGLGIEEASQEVQFGSYKGTVAHMLADEACPMGDKVQEAYREDGIEGVSKVFDGISQLDNNFKVEISAKTLERERPPAADPPEDVDSDRLPPQAPEKKTTVSRPIETARSPQTDLPATKKLPIPNEAEVVHRESESEEAEPAEGTEEIAAAPLERDVDEVEIRSHEQQPMLVDAVVIEPEQPAPIDVVVAEPKVSEPLIVKRESPVNVVGEPASKRVEVAAVAVTDETPLVSEKKVELQSMLMEEEAPAPVDATSLMDVTVEAKAPIADAPLLGEEKTILPVAAELLPDLRYIAQAEDTSDEIISDLGLPEQVVLPETTELIHEMSEALESLEPAEAQKIQAATAQMAEAVEQILALREAGQDSAEAEKVLQSACERLIEELGINYSEESVEQARLILVAYEARLEPGERPELETLADAGTHEFKLGYLSVPMLAHRAKQRFAPLRALGKRALTGSLAPV
jgi:hypothetical protein